MRLGQLARKLAVSPAEIIEYLAANNVEIENDTNTKLEAHSLALVTQRFGSALTDIAVEEEEKETEVDQPSVPETNVSEGVVADDTTETSPETSSVEEKTDVIRAPKVELSGLKVLGKIDLPEPKKKEPAPKEEGQETENKDRKPRRDERRNNNSRRDRKDSRPAKNPIALAREREAKEAEEKRRLQAQREKELRTQYYQSRVKAHVPTKPARLVKEQVEQMSEADLREPPKTWLGKFFRWLTSE